MYKKLAVVVGIGAFIMIIMAALIAHDWLTGRGEDPDTLVIEHTHVVQVPVPQTPEFEVSQQETEAPDDDGMPGDPPAEYTYPEDTPQEDTPPEDAPPEEDIEHPLAPDFTMLDIDDNELSLADFFGKPIVLNFWTTWCPSCVLEMPYFEQLYDSINGDVHIIKVNLLDGQRETRDRVDSFMEENGYSFPIFFDGGLGSIQYGVRYIPMTFFIDAQGNVVATNQGPVNEDILRRGLEAAGVEVDL